MLKTLFICIIFTHCIALLFAQTNLFEQCNAAFECVGTEWVLSNHRWIGMAGYGYKSLYGPSTSITGPTTPLPNQPTHDPFGMPIMPHVPSIVHCYGAFACEKISFIFNTRSAVDCSGSNSCANIHGKLSYIYAREVDCSGANSCQNSNIIASTSVFCQGSQSCIYTYISAQYVYGTGAYSLYQSIIDSKFMINNTINIHLYGYQSGFGATIICRAGDMCNIYCYNNGCDMLYVECEQNSDCNILLNNNDSSITIPPITNRNEYDYSLYDIKYDYTITVTNNDLCDYASNFVYDNGNEINYNNGQTIENSQVCCRGYYSCHSTNIVASDIMVCNGHASCSGAYTIINNTMSVFCEGSRSCMYAIANKANDVYCLGQRTCSACTISESSNVYCLGEGACWMSTIKSNGNDINIYLFGYRSGYKTKIYCGINDKCYIHCGGYQSCTDTGYDETILHCNNNCFVECNADTGCPKVIQQMKGVLIL